MDYQSRNNGLKTLLEHWGFVLTAVIAILASQILTFFTRLSGPPWIWFYVASLSLMILGGGLIGCARFPVYQSGKFFTFGLRSVPEHLQKFYRWGWLAFLLGVGLSLCLSLSKP
jgi:hypothetical protein